MLNNLNGKTILIVEDAPRASLDLQATLEAAGASVTCTDCAGALVLVERPFLSAAILHHAANSTDRRSMVRRLRERFIPFLLYDTERPASMASGRGAPFLAKPAQPEEILAAVSALLTLGKSS